MRPGQRSALTPLLSRVSGRGSAEPAQVTGLRARVLFAARTRTHVAFLYARQHLICGKCRRWATKAAGCCGVRRWTRSDPLAREGLYAARQHEFVVDQITAASDISSYCTVLHKEEARPAHLAEDSPSQGSQMGFRSPLGLGTEGFFSGSARSFRCNFADTVFEFSRRAQQPFGNAPAIHAVCSADRFVELESVELHIYTRSI